MKVRLSACLFSLLLLLPLPGCIRREKLPGGDSAAGSAAPAADPSSPGGTVVLHREGYAHSDESRYLVLRLGWTLTSTDGATARVAVSLSLSHYSISVGARENGSVTLGTEARSFATSAIEASGKEKTTTGLANLTFTLPLSELAGEGLPLRATWNFGGTYHGETVNYLTAACTVRAE